MTYYYRHTNGTIHVKPDVVVDPIGPEDYFDSPFCAEWWYEED